ncbi:MAG: glutathione S-transferase family protein [Paracoccaceae bacterium]
MQDSVTLHGYKFSVYTRIARLVLHENNVQYTTVEIDPFDPPFDEYLRKHPFGRVPTLTHGTFSFFETGAITRYVDRAFEGPALQPVGVNALARMDQVISVIDNYGYWSMVRQVFSHGYFLPLHDEEGDPKEIQDGLERAETVLGFLEQIVSEGLVLNGSTRSLADWHLAPMMDYFVRTTEGTRALGQYPQVEAWWERISTLDSLQETDPLSGGGL